MAFAPLNVRLEQPLSAKQSIPLPYPEGRNEGHFFGGMNHTLSIDGSFFRSPRDFTLLPQHDRILFTWNGPATLPKGLVLNFQADIPGGNYYFDAKASVTVQGMVHCPLFMVNLGAPLAPDEQYWVASDATIGTAPLKLAHTQIETARNVTVHSANDNSHVTFTIEGEDIYRRSLVEKITPTPSGKAYGKKTFLRISRITASHPCNGPVSIGTGDRFGLPVFLPSAGYLIREIVNGEAVTGGVVIAGETAVPLATTGDRRGTYTPPAHIELDGKQSIHLLLSLLAPSNIGIPDFAG